MPESEIKGKYAGDIQQNIINLLQEFGNNLEQNDLREQVLYLVKCYHQFRQLGVSLLNIDEKTKKSARDRILLYFRKYSGHIIHGDELMVISGIQDYPRRIRELRVQFGWPILSGQTIRQMIDDKEIISNSIKIETDSYLLIRDEQDETAAYRWNVANEIRREKTGGKSKIIKYFLKNVGRVISGDEIKYVANDSSEWARRVRELRTEEGWLIRTNLTGRSDLPQGFYILESDIQAESHDRHIPDDIQVQVLERDQFKCIRCGWTRNTLSPDDPRKRLELHHIHHHTKKGKNTKDNLATLCNVCHDLIHKADKGNEWPEEQFFKWAVYAF